MRLVKISHNHYINADQIIEVYPHLAEPGLTIVMRAPPAGVSDDTESARLKIYTIDLHGAEAQNVARWLESVAEDGLQHASLPTTESHERSER